MAASCSFGCRLFCGLHCKVWEGKRGREALLCCACKKRGEESEDPKKQKCGSVNATKLIGGCVGPGRKMITHNNTQTTRSGDPKWAGGECACVLVVHVHLCRHAIRLTSRSDTTHFPGTMSRSYRGGMGRVPRPLIGLQTNCGADDLGEDGREILVCHVIPVTPT